MKIEIKIELDNLVAKQKQLKKKMADIGIRELTDKEVRDFELQVDWNDTLERAGKKLFQEEQTHLKNWELEPDKYE